MKDDEVEEAEANEEQAKEESLEEEVESLNSSENFENFSEFSASDEIFAPVLETTDLTQKTEETPALERELGNVPVARREGEERTYQAVNMPEYTSYEEIENYENLERQQREKRDVEIDITGRITQDRFETPDIRPLRQTEQGSWRQQMEEPETREARNAYITGGVRERKGKDKLPHET